jgi:hypothetical protein
VFSSILVKTTFCLLSFVIQRFNDTILESDMIPEAFSDDMIWCNSLSLSPPPLSLCLCLSLSCVQDDQTALACEVLKALFNLTTKSGEREEEAEEKEAQDQFLCLTSILHDLLLCETQYCEKRHELHK